MKLQCPLCELWFEGSSGIPELVALRAYYEHIGRHIKEMEIEMFGSEV